MKDLKQVRSKVKPVYNDKYLHIEGSNLSQKYQGEGEEEVQTEGEETQEAQGGRTGDVDAGGGIMANLPPEIQNYIQAQIGNKQHGAMSQPPQGQMQQAQGGQMGSIQDVIEDIFGKEGSETNPSYSDATQEEEQRGSESPQNGSGQQESQQGDKSCTQEEREFLDAFMALQEAGSLLGMVPASRTVAGTNLKNIKLVPVVNEIKPSDKQFVAEVQEEDSVYKLMDTPMKTMFQSLGKMLTNKGIK